MEVQMHRLTGIPAAEGIALGAAFVYHPVAVPTSLHVVSDPDAELLRFRQAVARAKEQLAEIYSHAVMGLGQEAAAILTVQQMFLDDPALLDPVEGRIQSGLNADVALQQEVDRLATMLAGLEDSYLRERAADLRDVGQRVLRLLAGVEENSLASLDFPAVVVALDLTPSEAAQMTRGMVLGLATARGGRTSHTAILARTLGLPAVVGLGEPALGLIQNGAPLVLDGQAGLLLVDPDRATEEKYRVRQRRWLAARQGTRSAAQAPAVTRDGHRVQVAANIGDAASVETALAFGAEGVGLLRTEFLFLDRATLPDEEEQYAVYHRIATALGPLPLIVRTLDIGGDKPLPGLDLTPEANPFLGFRAIRMSLAQPEMFKTQLRAILRAAAGGQIQVMFPLIATVEEVRAARQMLAEARAELEERRAVFAAEIKVGIMVEVPAAAISIPILAPEVDFVSLGTNDLIQYALAVDRTNERVGYLYDPLHPAILHLVKKVIDDAHSAGKWVAMCGEMAGDLDAVPLLLGMGLDEFSVNAAAIPEVKALIRSLAFREMQDLVDRAILLATAAEIRALVGGRYRV
jgi:phosphoenolpyruvate-protein phosphotransferase (PTS system enzyme I)